MNTYTLLSKTIDQLQAQGKKVTVTQLPSQFKSNRKSLWIKK